MSDSGREIVRIASGEIGRTNGTRYGAKNGDPWCSEFVSWVYQQAGYEFTTGPDDDTWLLTSVSKIRAWFKENSTFIQKQSSLTPPGRYHRDWLRFTPTTGDYVCFGEANAPLSHSGIVESLDSNDTLHTIEGNASEVVDRREYPDFRTRASYSLFVKGFGLRCGKQIRIPNGTASASSSGDNRHPRNAFDGDNNTWWRNRTNRRSKQFLQMEWDNKVTITKVSLRFGNNYPRAYGFSFRIGISKANSRWFPSTKISDNSKKERAHVWFNTLKGVWGIRITCYEYSKEDYFSVNEMIIQR